MSDQESLAYRLSTLRPMLHGLSPNEAQNFLNEYLTPEELQMMAQAAIDFQALYTPASSDEN